MKTKRRIQYGLAAVGGLLLTVLLPCGCGPSGYSNSWPYPDQIHSVYVEMFDTSNFRRGYEYVLTDAICKRIEAQTPYKIVSDRDQADSVLSGALLAGNAVLTVDRHTGKPIEQESVVRVTFSWKNLRTGEVLVNNETVAATASYSRFLDQDYEYSAHRAVNKAAERVVQRMETTW